MTTRLLSRFALTGLVGLAIVSLALVPGLVGPGGIAAGTGHGWLPSGLVLATAKVIGLAWLFFRVARFDVYTMQWSSMFILLFFAEGAVRAGSDPPPLAALGLCEALLAALYFAAILAILRPLKREARAREAKR